jgi:hypothetical protein
VAAAETWHLKGCTLNVNKFDRKELWPILRYCPSIIFSERGGKLQNTSVAVVDYKAEIQIQDVLSAKVQHFSELAKQDYLHLL